MDASKVEAILAAMPEEERNVMIEALAAAKQEEPSAPAAPEKGEQDKQDEEPEEPEKPEEEMGKSDSEISKAMAELKKAHLEIANLRDEKALAGFVKVASEDMAHIPGMAPEDMGAVLKACSEKLQPEVFAKLKTTLTACSRVIEKGDLFVEIGAAGEKVNSSERLETMAKQYAKENNVSFYQAYAKVARDNPSLLREDQ